MALTSVPCHILGSNVTRVTDLEGRVTQLICPEYDPTRRLCRIRQRALSGGPLSQLLERVSEDTLAERGARCELC